MARVCTGLFRNRADVFYLEVAKIIGEKNVNKVAIPLKPHVNIVHATVTPRNNMLQMMYSKLTFWFK